jgi:hypothetical protein
MAKELPYFKFEPSEWITGNITLCSMEAQGLFVNLCAYYWIKDGNISLTNAKQRFSKCDALFEQLISNGILTLNNIENDIDVICIKFLDEQRDKFIDIVAKRSEAGKSAWGAKAEQKQSKSRAKDHIYNKDNNKDINILFDVFWNLYKRKQGSKKDCEKKWNKLTHEEHQKIIDTLPMFFASIRDEQFIPYPATYLNQRRWDNELSNSTIAMSVPSTYKNPTPDPHEILNWK